MRIMTPTIATMLIATASFAQNAPDTPIPGAPTDACSFQQTPPDTPIRMLSGESEIPYQFYCGVNRPAGVCRGGTRTAGTIVNVGAEKNGWSCVSGGDSPSGWVPSDRVGPVAEEPRIAAKDWIGWWRNGKPTAGVKGNRLLISPGKIAGTLHISGRAYWYGINDNVHLGGINTDHVVTIGRYLHAVEGDDLSGCVLDLKFDPVTHEFDASDNMNCGGMNVRFMGTWQKFTPSVEDKKDAAHLPL